MSSFVLKIIALITMLCDHIGLTFIEHTSYLNIIGRISFPIFAFQISEGFKHTKNLKKYIIRLIIFAVLSQMPYTLYLNSIGIHEFGLNIFFTLLIGLISIIIYENLYNKYKKFYIGIIPVILLTILAELIKCDYGWYGVTIIFLFHLFKENKLYMNFIIIYMIINKYIIDFIFKPSIYQLYFAIGAIISVLIINLYNNKKGKNIKYLLYIFYPLHLIILVLIKMYILQ